MATLMEILSYTVAELQDKLQQSNLNSEGSKKELQQRMLETMIEQNVEQKLVLAESERQNTKRKEDEQSSSKQSSYNMIREKNRVREDDEDSLYESEITRRRYGRIKLRKMVAPFKGIEGESFELFAESIRTIKNKYEVDEDEMRLQLADCLEDRARNWFLCDPNNLKLSVDEILSELNDLFNTRKSKSKQRKLFEERVWKHSEDFYAYYTDKMILAVPLKFEDDELVDGIIDGIQNIGLQNQARLQCYQKPKQLLLAFIKIVKPSNTTVRGRFEQFDDKSKSEKQAGSGFKSEQREGGSVKQSTSWGVRCYNCGERGHLSKKCEKPKRANNSCFRCGEIGHKLGECQNERKKQVNNMNEGEEIGVTQNCSVFADEHPIQMTALIDSGSPVTLVKVCKIVKPELIKPIGDKKDLTGINNSKVKCIGIINVNVLIFGNLYNIDCIVVENNTMLVELLLGRDFLRIAKDDLKIEDHKINFETEFCQELMHIDLIENPLENQIKINDSLDIDTKSEIYQMINDNYFSTKKPNVPEVKFEMNIELVHDKLITAAPRRLSYAERDIVAKMLDELLEKGFIRVSESKYCSPIVLIKKKNKEEYRLCVDYRALNKITVKSNYPLPIIEDILEFLHNKRFFTSLDLKSGFHHVTIAPDSIPYTSFVTPLGQYEYLRLPFGLKNGPAEFQKYVNKIFAKLIAERKVVIYIDDIFIATKEIGEHLEILYQVLKLLSANLLELRLNKCEFLYTQIDYLGYSINEKGIRPNDRNISAIEEYPVPRNNKEIQSFLGLCSYFRKFIEGFALIAKPLQDLLRRNAEYLFEQDEMNSFESLKRKLIESPILAIYSPNDDTELHCDASSIGFGAILLQKKKDGKWHPISYFSRRTTENESRLHSYELECLAIIYAFRRFRIFFARSRI